MRLPHGAARRAPLISPHFGCAPLVHCSADRCARLPAVRSQAIRIPSRRCCQPPACVCAGPDGPAVPHGSRVKVRLTLPDGQAVDRLPAWVRRAVAPPGQMGARFDGVHWAPPQHERHAWCASDAAAGSSLTPVLGLWDAAVTPPYCLLPEAAVGS